MTDGIDQIAAERARQLAEQIDDTSERAADGQLVDAAVAYLLDSNHPALAEMFYPWSTRFTPNGSHVRRLQIAGALIAAELDRLQTKETLPWHQLQIGER